jgi:Carboxypeptidase regulatory-like domain/Putative zinc-finger
MSEQLQLGHHPDADEISAFVEHALPTHERERVLSHLANCAECREIVTLSLPEIQDPAPAVLIRPRKSWWSGGVLAWPLGAALAATACIVLYIHHASVAPNAPPQQQVAVAHAPAPPELQEKSIPPVGGSAERGIAAGPTASRRVGSVDERKQKPGTEDGAILTGGNAAELIKIQPGASAQNLGPASGSTIGSGSGGGVVSPPVPADQLTLKSDAPAPATGAAIASERQTAAPRPGDSATSVSVVSGSQSAMEVESAGLNKVVLAQDEIQLTHLKRRLPSHLPALSAATQGSLVVAIDRNNAVFLSKDSGKHWKPIRAPWQGLAMKAALVEIKPAKPSRLDKAVSAFASTAPAGNVVPSVSSDPLALQRRSAEAESVASLRGTVTDQSGAMIRGASVTVTDNATGATTSLKTDPSGQYVFAGLDPGTYRVDAQSEGFEKQEVAAVSVGPSGQSFANLSLRVSASSQTVEVTAAAPELSLPTPPADQPAATKQPTLVFEITTANGERWTSSDGLTWTHM